MTTRKIKSVGMPTSRPFALSPDKKYFMITKDRISRFLKREYEEIYAFTGDPEDKHRSIFAYFEGDSVLAFEKAELTTFLKRANLEIKTLADSDSENVKYVLLKKALKASPHLGEILKQYSLKTLKGKLNDRITSTEYHGESEYDTICLVDTILSPVLKRKIALSVPHGDTAEYNESGDFQVRIWSGPSGSVRSGAPPSKIWGYDVSCLDSAFSQLEDKGKHACIYIKDGDYVVATVFQNALYIHHDIIENGDIEAKNILTWILIKTAKILSDTDAWDKAIKVQEKAWKKRQTEMLSDFVLQSIPAKSKAVHGQIEHLKSEISGTQKLLNEKHRSLFLLEKSKLNQAELANNFKREVKSLQSGKIPFVENVYFQQNRGCLLLHVITESLIGVDNRSEKKYKLGRANITIDFSKINVMVKGIDENRRFPHMLSDGLCTGNVSQEIREYIANFEIRPVITLVLSIIREPNTYDSAGQSIEEFPEIKQ